MFIQPDKLIPRQTEVAQLAGNGSGGEVEVVVVTR